MPRKAAPVEGVYEREPDSGIWYVRFRVNGKLVRKSFGRNRAAAINYVEKARTVRRSGEGVLPSTAKQPARTAAEVEKLAASVTVANLCDDYITHIQSRPDLFRDQKNPAHRVELIREAFGHREASTIRPWEIEDWLTKLSNRKNGRPLKPGTVNRMKAHLSAIYQHGKLRDKVQYNPARDVKQRRTNNGVIRFLRPEEEKRLRAAILGWSESKAHLAQYQAPLITHRLCELTVALGTGMRKSEQYGLKWRDVDFTAQTVTLHKTKNGDGRVVHLIQDVIEALKTLRALDLTRREGRVNPTPDDMVFAIGDNKKWFQQAVKDAKLDTHLRWHDLRHTFCSRLAQAGVNLKVIQEAAGHKTIAMTVRYAHLESSTIRNALAVLNRQSVA
jgi:integrase